MTGVGVKEFLLRVLYQDNATTAPASFHHDAAFAINAALQEIYKSPLGEAWSRRVWTFNTVPGVTDYTISREVSNVLGDVRCDGNQVTECKHEGTFTELASRYGITAGIRPSHYVLQRLHAGSANVDATIMQMQLWPAPRRPHAITFDALVEPRNFTACDLTDTNVIISVPDQQSESILIPIAADYLMLSSKMINDRIRESVANAAGRARALLGYSEPSPAKREGRAA